MSAPFRDAWNIIHIKAEPGMDRTWGGSAKDASKGAAEGRNVKVSVGKKVHVMAGMPTQREEVEISGTDDKRVDEGMKPRPGDWTQYGARPGDYAGQ